MEMVALGIDPGKSGGIAAVSFGGPIKLWTAPLPYATKDDQPDVQALRMLLQTWDVEPVLAGVELVNSFGMGRQSAFVFGQGVGALLATLTILGVPVIRPIPRAWLSAVGGTGKMKTEGGAAGPIGRLFPGHTFVAPGCRVQHSGMIDAAGIAYFTRQRVGRSAA